MELSFFRLDEGRMDPSDTTFRVRSRHAPSLRESIERNGIRTPIIVESRGDRFRIVSGWGRWLARPQAAPLPCFVLPTGLSLEALWDVFLHDNDTWNVVEVARILRALDQVPGLSEERIVAEKLPLLGMHPSRDLYRRHRDLTLLSPEAQRFLEEENLPLRRTPLFFRLAPDALDLLLRTTRELHLTLNELAEVVELLDEIAQRDGIGAKAVLESALAAGAGKESFRRELRQRRYPELSRYRAIIGEVEKRLSFSVPVRIRLLGDTAAMVLSLSNVRL